MAERNAGQVLSTLTRRPHRAHPSTPPAPLIGREDDLAVVTGLVRGTDHRLLTLTGPGGAGKSCLAATVAARLPAGFADVWYADLAEVEVPSLTGAAVAEALDLTGTPGRPVREELAEFLAGRDAVLILDGCEHLADAAASLVAGLLAACPGLRVLATSRTPLRVRGEGVVTVAPLPVPSAADLLRPCELERVPAVALFVERMRAANPGFVLTGDNAGTVGEICVLLDGLPAAIEIAADRARLLGLSRLLTRLRDGQDILRGGHPGVPARHRSLRALTEGSHRLLDPGHSALLDLLAVCEGDFDLGTIETLWPVPALTVDQVLETLADGHLILTTEQSDGEPRFRLPATVRAFCRERLRESGRLPEARRRHAEHVRARVTAPPRHVRLSIGDVRTALDHFIEREDHAAAAEVALATAGLWLGHGRSADDLRRLETIAFSGAEDHAGLRARVAVVASRLAVALGDPVRAVDVCEHARGLQRDEVGEAAATAELGRALMLSGPSARARTLLAAGIAGLRSRGEAATAVPAVLALAAAHRADGDLDQAEELLTGVVSTATESGDVRGVALAEAQLALVAAERGRTARADRHHRRSLRRLLDLEVHLDLAAGFEAYALFLWTACGQSARAVRLLAAADTTRRAALGGVTDTAHPALEETRRKLRIELGAPDFDAEWDEGARRTGRAAVMEVLSAPTAAEDDPAARPGSPRLTPRQLEVATLVAQGMTNRQISRELDISQWTVVNHVREVMRRLNAPSRVHVAQWVARRD